MIKNYIQRVKDGDFKAFSHIVSDYQQMVFTTVCRIVDNREDAEDIFREIEPKNPSDDFMKNLMVRVEKESIRQGYKKQIYSYLLASAGIIGIIGIPALVLSFLKIEVSFNLNISNVFRGVTIEPSYIVFSLIILFLLIGDIFLRKHFRIF